MATLNVQTDYGAAGDGSTDDTSPIQNAIDDAGAGDTVYLPAGTYVVGKANSVDSSMSLLFNPKRGNGVDDVTFQGDGADTKIELSDGNDSYVAVLGVRCTEAITGLTIRDCIVDGRRAAQNTEERGSGVVITEEGSDSNDIVVENLKVIDAPGTGIGPRAGGVEVRDCTVKRSSVHGIGIGHSTNGVTVRRCLCENNPNNGDTTYNLDFSNGGGLVEDCVFKGGDGTGFKITADASTATFRRVRVENSGIMGFQKTGSGSCTAVFEDVVFRNGNDQAMRLPAGLTVKNPSGTEIVAYNHPKNGILAVDDARIEGDGVYHSDSNKRSLYAGSSNSGYASDLQEANNSYSINSGGIDVQSVGSSTKTDLDNVPTASEVGAFTNTNTDDPQNTYETDFGAETVGEQPVDWAREWATSSGEFTVADGNSLVGGKRLELAAGSATRRGLRWTSPGDVADVELHALVTVPEFDPDRDDHCRLYARGSGSAGNESAYFLSLRKDGFGIQKYVNGSATQLWSGGTPSAGEQYMVRFRVEGTDLRLKTWLESESEPTNWDATVTDSDLSSAGWAGVGAFSHATQYWDAVTAGTGGLDAPSITTSTSGSGSGIRSASGSVQTTSSTIETN